MMTPIRQLLHFIGHVFDMDCGVTNEHRPGFARCKACGAEVSTLPRQWRTK
jgi:hypothetical protein